MRTHSRTATLFALLCGGSTLEFEWHATQDTGSSTVGWYSWGRTVSPVTDGAGGAFVVGHSTAGTMKLGGSSITLGFPKIVLARVSSEVANTNKFVWAMKMGGNGGEDRILDLAYDGSGGV